MDQRRNMATSQKANRVPRTTFKVAHLYKKVPERSQSFCESLFWWFAQCKNLKRAKAQNKTLKLFFNNANSKFMKFIFLAQF